jgi:hypothetical protein
MTKKDTAKKAVDISEILVRMREDQRQFDRKIAELRCKTRAIKGEEKMRDGDG